MSATAVVISSLRVGPLALRVEEGALVVEERVEDEVRSARLPLHAVRAVLTRFGRPLDETVPPPAALLALDDDFALAALSYRSPVDVIANDYVLLQRRDDSPPLATPAPLFVAALRRLTGT